MFEQEFAKSLIAQAFLICLVGSAYFSLRSSLKDDGFHALNVAILFLAFAAVGGGVWKYVRASRALHIFIHKTDKGSLDTIKSTSELALNYEVPEQRRKAARALYCLYGIPAAYRDAGGKLTAYEPDAEDEEKRAQRRASDEELVTSIKRLDGTLERMPETAMIVAWKAGGIFLLILLGDILWMVYLRPERSAEKQPLDGGE